MNKSVLHITKMVAGASLLALALPAQAAGEQTDTANKVVAQNESGGPAAKEKLICKRFDNTASRMKAVRLCYTAEQWKKFDQERF